MTSARKIGGTDTDADAMVGSGSTYIDTYEDVKPETIMFFKPRALPLTSSPRPIREPAYERRVYARADISLTRSRRVDIKLMTGDSRSRGLRPSSDRFPRAQPCDGIRLTGKSDELDSHYARRRRAPTANQDSVRVGLGYAPRSAAILYPDGGQPNQSSRSWGIIEVRNRARLSNFHRACPTLRQLQQFMVKTLCLLQFYFYYTRFIFTEIRNLVQRADSL
ncbi:hypothetical protein EIP91_004195 [Steccherinum ochraceum]|uniref:Uncharacterized protein n=1 Tax=Steccherinum ochraceum TaxID=92696 RepID=A0A4R0RPP3_9APHY|nr:hypothetical protein EIP91_004195 [Steccherinum ochraceum]